MDMSQYLEIFIEETKEHLQGLNQSLLQLETNPEDASMLNEIFRVAHTLKGMSGTMGFSKMAKLTHDMENVLHALRNNELKVCTKLVDVLFKCLDALENYLDSIVNTGTEGNNEYTEIIQALNNIINKKHEAEEVPVAKPSAKPVPAVAEKEVHPTSDFSVNQYEQNVINKAKEVGMNALQITVVLNKGCLLKSARAFIIFQTLERYAEIIKSEPKVQDIEDERFDYEFTVVVISKESLDLFAKELNSIAEVDKVIIKPLESRAVENEAPVNVQQEKPVQAAVVTQHEESKTETEETPSAKAASTQKPKTGKTVRVDIDRLDVLMNLVGELIITKTRLEGTDIISNPQEYNETVEYLERITTSLNDAVMKVRMVPVETVFNRFPRMIRDISRDLGKEIILKMSGEETELDRTVIDEIGDPLIHLLRNSVDHGIESLEKRRELGKPEAGHINLRAYQSGNNVIIEVEDDGQGINTERVKKKAIERGLINKDVANSLSQQDIIEFLFKPSFSTADKITDLSGRGVGLDVVKTKIESLGGRVEVETELGKGSRFVIRLPLTLAIYQALLVLVGKEKYAIPLSSINQIINISPDEIKMVQKQEVILLRNTVVPIVRLANVLDVPREDKVQKQLTIVIVRKGEKLSGFMVDSVIGQQEIVIKSLGKLLTGIKSIAGATILGDGNVALIVDVNSLV
ncbi:MAG: chemotaxis protein CheA [Clostridia bacterium]|nr:chemotaxis protein CheA [Clostridia bacterium]